MKKLLFGTMLLALVIAGPLPMMAEVNISIGIPLPPVITFTMAPEVIVIPGTYVYVIPDIDVDVFFYSGWWWRPWEGRWYRSRYYDRDWIYYNYIPAFYYDIDFGWRGYYRDRNWRGHRWEYQRIPYHHLQQNWRGWDRNRYWEKQRSWNVEKYQPPSPQQRQELRRQRQREYARSPEVRKHEQWKKEQQRQPQVHQPRQQQQQRQPEVQQPRQQQQQRQPEVQQPRQQQQRQSQGQQPKQRQQQRQPQGQQPQHSQPQEKPEGKGR